MRAAKSDNILDRTGPTPLANLLLFNGVRLKRFIVENPSYFTGPELAGVPTSIVTLDPQQLIPYTIQYGGESSSN